MSMAFAACSTFTSSDTTPTKDGGDDAAPEDAAPNDAPPSDGGGGGGDANDGALADGDLVDQTFDTACVGWSPNGTTFTHVNDAGPDGGGACLLPIAIPSSEYLERDNFPVTQPGSYELDVYLRADDVDAGDGGCNAFASMDFTGPDGGSTGFAEGNGAATSSYALLQVQTSSEVTSAGKVNLRIGATTACNYYVASIHFFRP